MTNEERELEAMILQERRTHVRRIKEELQCDDEEAEMIEAIIFATRQS